VYAELLAREETGGDVHLAMRLEEEKKAAKRAA
jgi:hypothetical protein